MLNRIRDGWKFFRAHFKEGERVVVITDDDEVFAGKGTFLELGISLASTHRKPKFFYWEDVAFISHDGFPVKKLLGADGSDSIEGLDTKDLERDIIESLSESDCKKYDIVKGDPFLIENCKASLVRCFYPKFPNLGTEDCIQLISNDGAVGLLYDFPTIFHFEEKTA